MARELEKFRSDPLLGYRTAGSKAEFEAGDNSLMSRPRVLHKDQDYLNYNSFNLEWAEEDSPEYQAYMWQKKDDLDRLTIQENPNHPNPLMKPLH